MTSAADSPRAEGQDQNTPLGRTGTRYVSEANRRAAARVFVRASELSGDPVPDYIRALAEKPPLGVWSV